MSSGRLQFSRKNNDYVSGPNEMSSPCPAAVAGRVVPCARAVHCREKQKNKNSMLLLTHNSNNRNLESRRRQDKYDRFESFPRHFAVRTVQCETLIIHFAAHGRELNTK